MATTDHHDHAGVIWVTRSYAQCGGCQTEFLALPDNGAPMPPKDVEAAYRVRGWRKVTPTQENAVKGDGWVCPICAARLRKSAMNGTLKNLASRTDRGIAARNALTSSSDSSSAFDPEDGSPYEPWEVRKS